MTHTTTPTDPRSQAHRPLNMDHQPQHIPNDFCPSRQRNKPPNLVNLEKGFSVVSEDVPASEVPQPPSFSSKRTNQKLSTSPRAEKRNVQKPDSRFPNQNYFFCANIARSSSEPVSIGLKQSMASSTPEKARIPLTIRSPTLNRPLKISRIVSTSDHTVTSTSSETKDLLYALPVTSLLPNTSTAKSAYAEAIPNLTPNRDTSLTDQIHKIHQCEVPVKIPLPQNKMTPSATTPRLVSEVRSCTSHGTPPEAKTPLHPPSPLRVGSQPDEEAVHIISNFHDQESRDSDEKKFEKSLTPSNAQIRDPEARSHSGTGKRQGLTLSAFRRPEVAVRLTSADPDASIHSRYDLRSPHSRVLGHGASSTVRLAVRRSDDELVAVKTLAKHDVLRGRINRPTRKLDECEILQALKDHPNIVTLLDVYETEADVQLVMEYCEGGELFDAIQMRRRKNGTSSGSGFTEAEAAHIVSQLLSALSRLHAENIVHRDVKPENVLLVSKREGETNVKLSDFGLARVLHNNADTDSNGPGAGAMTPPSDIRRSRAYSRVGSHYYAAPEVGAGSGYDTAVDVYSLGVTMYILLCGTPPANEDACVDFTDSFWSNVSESAKDLIRRMLCPDPLKRITAKEAMHHDWVVEHSKQRCSSPAIAAYNSSTVRSPLLSPTAKTLDSVRNRLFQSSSPRLSRKRSLSCASEEGGIRKKLLPSAPTPPSLLVQWGPQRPLPLSMAYLYNTVNLICRSNECTSEDNIHEDDASCDSTSSLFQTTMTAALSV